MSAAKPLKVQVLGGGKLKVTRQNAVPKVLQGKTLRQVALPPDLAKVLASTSSRSHAGAKATNLAQVIAKLQAKKVQVG